MIVFRHADSRFPFLWEDSTQPPARWHGEGEGPAHYFADTPDGAWAEFLRHEEIQDPADLAGIRRALWAVEVPNPGDVRPDLAEDILLGNPETYPLCRRETARLRSLGTTGFRSPSAALLPGGARGWIVDGGLKECPARDGEVLVLLGHRSDLVGWPVTLDGRPPEYLLQRVRHFQAQAQDASLREHTALPPPFSPQPPRRPLTVETQRDRQRGALIASLIYAMGFPVQDLRVRIEGTTAVLSGKIESRVAREKLLHLVGTSDGIEAVVDQFEMVGD
ncbi:MAG TPA: RES domain-containing protein [Thermoanaerobaculia bacterium]|nr:RES domain-containing protein [Thermoanaerobaculia bacterium]